MNIILTALASLGSKWFENKSRRDEAKHERELQIIRGERSADQASSEGMSTTLKDEYLTIILTTPLIVIFYSAVWGDPEMIDQVIKAFHAMSQLPDWFQWSFMGCVAATFGIRSIKSFGGQ
jgi:hypothetical protein